jgi:hypothetical protein
MKSEPILKWASILLSLFFLVGCATTGKLIKLNLDMTKEQVINTIGKPDAARGSMRNKYDQVIEVWEYLEYKTDDHAFYGITTPYWLYFYNGRLVQWGQAGDWKQEADRIYEMRFR